MSHFAILLYLNGKVQMLFCHSRKAIHICQLTNYRPNFLTCTLAKIKEQIIKDNSLAYVLAQNLISANQHGFVLGRSTCSQLIECQYDGCSGMDDSGIFDLVVKKNQLYNRDFAHFV